MFNELYSNAYSLTFCQSYQSSFRKGIGSANRVMVRFPKFSEDPPQNSRAIKCRWANCLNQKGSSQKHETQHDTTANASSTSFGSKKQPWTLPLQMNQKTACSMQCCIFREIISASVLSFQQLGIRKFCLAMGEFLPVLTIFPLHVLRDLPNPH